MAFDPNSIRSQFPIFANGGADLHYLDNGATGQTPRAVIDAVVAFETTSRANVLRGVHRLAEAATEAALLAGLSVLGLPNEVGLPSVFLFRLMTFWLPILPGWIALRTLQRMEAI